MIQKRTFIYGVFITILVISSSIFAMAASDDNKPLTGEIFLYTGSPLVLSNGEVEMLDSTNPDVGATVVNSRTLLPLRAVSELFGAEVSYIQKEREAIVKYNGKQFVFPINQKQYIVKDNLSSKEYAMDSNSIIMDGRTMVPLRVICENVFGRKVSYYDRVIAVADREINLQADITLLNRVKTKIGEAVKARTMKELKLALTGDQMVRYFSEDLADGLSPVAKEESTTANASAQSSPDSSYSTTNVQVEGIDEADVVKTGRQIYLYRRK